MGKGSNFWLILYSITFLELLYLELVILFLKPYWLYVNKALKFLFGEGVEYGYVLLLFVLIPLVYTGYLLYKSIKGALLKQDVHFRIVNRVLPPIILIIFAGFLQCVYGQFGDEISIVYRSFENYGFVFFVALSSLIVTMFIKFVIPGYSQIKDIGKPGSAIIVLFLIVILLPFIFTPPNVLSGDLPDKPIIISHRGGGFYAPENTIEAMQYAVDQGITYLEVDVQVSNDGQLFLLHDDTLKRTTDVEDLYPNQADYDAATFDMVDLRSLDAGSWYVDNDPYQMKRKGEVRSAEVESYRGIKIPLFEEALNFSRDNSIFLDVDFKEPDDAHPYYNQYYTMVYDEINASGISLDRFIIFSEFNSNLQNVEGTFPDCITTIDLNKDTPKPTKFSSLDGASFHHSVPDDIVQSYLDAGLEVNIYTVISTMRFSQLWSIGVNYVVSDLSLEFLRMSDPQWSMQKSTYITLWSVFFSLQIMITIFFIIRKKRQMT
jgi:glycerophosphoryl diester phosphodiesterase